VIARRCRPSRKPEAVPFGPSVAKRCMNPLTPTPRSPESPLRPRISVTTGCDGRGPRRRWIPPGVDLPAGVDLLEPQHRTGDLGALLGPTALSATYTPGDPFGNAAQFDVMTRTTARVVRPRSMTWVAVG
jgi:hypothetical protein